MFISSSMLTSISRLSIEHRDFAMWSCYRNISCFCCLNMTTDISCSEAWIRFHSMCRSWCWLRNVTSEMYNRDNVMSRSIIAELIIFQISAYITRQLVQSYTHFKIYSKVEACWVQSKIWWWRDQTDRLLDSSNFDDRTVWYSFIEIRLAVLCWFEFWMFYTDSDFMIILLQSSCN